MPGQLLNINIDKLCDGVSQQYAESRFVSQVEEMVNCMPTLARGVLRRNPIRNIKYLQIDDLEMADVFTYAYDRGTGSEQYIFVISAGGRWKVFNINTGEIVGEGTHPYLTVDIPDTKVADAFDMITIGDHTFVVNKTKLVKMDSLSQAGGLTEYESWAFYWIKKTTLVTISQYQLSWNSNKNSASGTYAEGYTYTLNDGDTSYSITGARQSKPETPNWSTSTAYEIAADIANQSDDWINIEDTAFVYRLTTPTKWEWSDTFGNEASIGVWKTVDSEDKLPANLPEALDGFIVRVSGSTGTSNDDYYVKYIADRETWEEVPKPGSLTRLDPNSMPHVIYALVDSTDPTKRNFIIDTYQEVTEDGTGLTGDTKWGERLSGDEDTNPNPSFVDNRISSMFFYRNRLGVISNDSIVLSSTGDYGNFFATTVQEVYDDDPIDVAVATINVTKLHHGVSTAGGLILFSDDAQFLLSPGNQTLTPNTASIVSLSNYNYNPKIPPVAIGNSVYFTSIVGDWLEVFKYRLTSANDLTGEATELTLHIPHYIPKTVTNIVGHSVKGFVFFEDNRSQNLYVLSTQTMQEQDIQNAFHRWTITKNIIGAHIINEELVLLCDDGTLGTINLDIPKSINTIRYIDGNLETPQLLNEYTSYLKFSEFFVRTPDTKGTPRGRTQIRTIKYVISDYSHYMTSIITKDVINLPESEVFFGEWDDTGFWDDTLVWFDAAPRYTRIYKDDPKITVSGNSQNTDIVFSENPDYKDKGFELQMLNVEAYYFSRSRRVA